MRTSVIILFVFAMLLCNGQTFVPEHEAVSISLSTDKTSYYPFEPVHLKIELKNTSNQKQPFRDIIVTGTVLKYQIESKKKKFNPFDAFRELVGSGGMTIINEENMVLPNQTKMGEVVINKYFDLSGYYGDLKITFGYPIYTFKEGEGELLTGYKNKSIKIVIKREPQSESIPVALFTEVVSKILGSDISNKKIESNLEKLINEFPDSYLVDQSLYMLSVYYYQGYLYNQKPEQLEAAKKYLSELILRFSNSIYREEAANLEKLINSSK